VGVMKRYGKKRRRRGYKKILHGLKGDDWRRNGREAAVECPSAKRFFSSVTEFSKKGEGHQLSNAEEKGKDKRILATIWGSGAHQTRIEPYFFQGGFLLGGRRAQKKGKESRGRKNQKNLTSERNARKSRDLFLLAPAADLEGMSMCPWRGRRAESEKGEQDIIIAQKKKGGERYINLDLDEKKGNSPAFKWETGERKTTGGKAGVQREGFKSPYIIFSCEVDPGQYLRRGRVRATGEEKKKGKPETSNATKKKSANRSLTIRKKGRFDADAFKKRGENWPDD